MTWFAETALSKCLLAAGTEVDPSCPYPERASVCRTEAGNATAHSDEWIMSPRMVDPCPGAWGAIQYPELGLRPTPDCVGSAVTREGHGRTRLEHFPYNTLRSATEGAPDGFLRHALREEARHFRPTRVGRGR